MRRYFRDIYKTITTILIGMRITLRYHFAKVVTVQYPDVAPVLQPRFRGFHFFEIEKCIACDNCARACPVDCIYIEKSGPRKIDKATQIARGGSLGRFAIDYSKCMFCALCVEPCPTDCIHMGDIHDMSGYSRASMTVEFTELAKEGLQTPQPLWMTGDNLPAWAAERRQRWIDRGTPLRAEMLKALEETEIVKPKKPAKPPAKPAAKATSEKVPAPAKAAGDASVTKHEKAEKAAKPAGDAKPPKPGAAESSPTEPKE